MSEAALLRKCTRRCRRWVVATNRNLPCARFAVEQRAASIVKAAEDAIFSLKRDLASKVVRLPKLVSHSALCNATTVAPACTRSHPAPQYVQTQGMKLKDFQEKYPEDFKTGAMLEIKQRFAAMADAVQQAVPHTGARKRAMEPPTVMQTVKARRTGGALMRAPLAGAPAAPAAARRGTRGLPEPEDAGPSENLPESDAAPQMGPPENRPAPRAGVFNGLPLQTPMPFAGQAQPMPVTMLTQKRGGRTKAVAEPSAAVVTTADGMQWALGKDGVAGIPETHRAEIAELLSAQFNFLAAALGRTVFDRPAGRGGRRG